MWSGLGNSWPRPAQIAVVGGGGPVGSGPLTLPSSRVTDWTFAGVPGGIPARTTVAATFSPGATAAAITAAIDAAAAESVVVLNAGTYTAATLAGTILVRKSNVTLRGAGPASTILQGGTILQVGTFGGGTTLGTAITAGGAKGTTSITVASTTNLAVGTMIHVDRVSDPSIVVIPPANEPPAPWTGRDIGQVNVITAIAGNVLTVRNPWIYDFSTGSPAVKFYWPAFIARAGVEELKLDHQSVSAVGCNWGDTDSCWMRGVESTNSNGYHIITIGTVNCEWRFCFIHDGGSGPNNSGINLFDNGGAFSGGNSHAKIESNIFNKNFPQIELNGATGGCVFLYNYSYGTIAQGGVGLVTWTFDAAHAAFPLMNLWEGNSGENLGGDGYFGGAGHNTVLRNYVTGFNPNYTVTGDAIALKRFNYYYNIIGNVLGSSSQLPVNYDTACGAPGIYSLGYPNIGNCDTVPFDGFMVSGGYPDPKVKTTLLRWGNYDYFNAAARYVIGEIPADVATPDPTNHTIPNSYYYAAVPAWWHLGLIPVIPWPPIGPDVTGGNADTAGHANKVPAQVCWETQNLLTGGAYNPKTFYGY